MPIKVVTNASILPVNITLAVRAMRVLESDLDVVALYLQAATEAVEEYTGRSFMTKTFRLDLPDWSPVPREIDVRLRPNAGLPFIELRRTPLLAVDSVKYYAPGNAALTTLSTDNYRVDTSNQPGRVQIVDGVELPDLEARYDAVQITFTAGVGTKASSVPARAQVAIIQLARHWFDNEVPVADIKMQEMPLSFRYLLRGLRVDSLTQE